MVSKKAMRMVSKLPEPTEEEFFNQIKDVAHLYGWRIAHFRAARTAHGWRTAVAGDGAGFPDCVLVREHNGRAYLIFCELKSNKGKLTAGQQEWLDLLSKIEGIGVYVWRPSDFESIVEILRKTAGHQ